MRVPGQGGRTFRRRFVQSCPGTARDPRLVQRGQPAQLARPSFRTAGGDGMRYPRLLASRLGATTVPRDTGGSGAQTVITGGMTRIAGDPTVAPVRMSDLAFWGTTPTPARTAGSRSTTSRTRRLRSSSRTSSAPVRRALLRRVTSRSGDRPAGRSFSARSTRRSPSPSAIAWRRAPAGKASTSSTSRTRPHRSGSRASRRTAGRTRTPSFPTRRTAACCSTRRRIPLPVSVDANGVREHVRAGGNDRPGELATTRSRSSRFRSALRRTQRSSPSPSSTSTATSPASPGSRVAMTSPSSSS